MLYVLKRSQSRLNMDERRRRGKEAKRKGGEEVKRKGDEHEILVEKKENLFFQ